MPYDFTEEEKIELIPDGDYEAVLSKAEIRQDKNKTMDFMKLEFTIRDDVDQGSKGRKVFETVFREKENAKLFEMWKLRPIVLTQKDKEGFTGKFDTDDELVQFLNHIVLRIHVSKNIGKKDGKESNIVDFKKCTPTSLGDYVPPVPTAQSGEAKDNLGSIDVADADLPF